MAITSLSLQDRARVAELIGSKTMEQWQAIEAAERKTFTGSVKWVCLDYIYYPLYRWFMWLIKIPSQIHSFYQRGRRGWADSDAWDIDSYLSSFLPQLLRYMVNQEVGGGNSYPGTPGAETPEQWERIVEKIARGFEAERAIEDITYINYKDFQKQYRKLKQQQDEGLALFVKYYDALWD